jgi:hypothetical protein
MWKLSEPWKKRSVSKSTVRVFVELSAILAHKDVQLNELQRQVTEMKDEIVDYDGTIGQFRELVTSLQR